MLDRFAVAEDAGRSVAGDVDPVATRDTPRTPDAGAALAWGAGAAAGVGRGTGTDTVVEALDGAAGPVAAPLARTARGVVRPRALDREPVARRSTPLREDPTARDRASWPAERAVALLSRTVGDA
jgi:hypothetical protein